jgi:cytochrome P450 PksS
MTQVAQPNLASPQFKADPHPFYTYLRHEAPVYRAVLPDRRVVWLLARYDDTIMLLKDERFVKDRTNTLTPEEQPRNQWVPGCARPLARNMLDLDAPDHARLRLLVSKVFTRRLVEQLRGRVEELCDGFLTAAQRRGSLDLIRDYALPLPTTVIAEMLGVPVEDRTRFHRWSAQIIAIASGTDQLRALPSLWLFIRYLRALFQQRRAQPRADLISELIQVQEAGDRLSEDELLARVFILLVAGHETTVNLIGTGTLALLDHPAQTERVRRDPAIIQPAVEELVRYASPVDLATERYAREDITIHDLTIPRGEMVLGIIGSANRDEQHFVNGQELDLTRELTQHLGFGQGAHSRLGAPLARLEGQVAINMLLQRFPNLRLAVPRESLIWRRGLFMRGLTHLPLLVD